MQTAAPAVAKLRRTPATVGGYVAPGFEKVRVEFERNFAERGEIGAAVAAYVRGERVVDLWGGHRTPERDAPWKEDTMVVVASTTKGLSAMTLAIANARGWLDYNAPVARYWPEFAQNGKAAITVRQLLGHEAGLVFPPRAADGLVERPTEPRGRSAGRQRSWYRPRDCARLFGLRRRRSGARAHLRDFRAAHGAARVPAPEGRDHGVACVLLARLPAPRSTRRIRLEPPSIRYARRGRLFRLRGSRSAPRLRVRDEQDGFLLARRSAGEALRDAVYKAMARRVSP